MPWMRYTIGGPITREAAEELQELLNNNFGDGSDDVMTAIAEGRAVEVAEHDPEESDVDSFLDKHKLSFLQSTDDDDRGGMIYWRKPGGTTGECTCDGEGDPIFGLGDLREAAKKGRSLADVIASFEVHEGAWVPALTLKPSDADLLVGYGYKLLDWDAFKAATDRPPVLLKRAKPHHKDDEDFVVYEPAEPATGWLLVGEREKIAAETVAMIRAAKPTTGPLAIGDIHVEQD